MTETFIQAPYPQLKAAIALPAAQFDDSKASESEVQLKRTMLGRPITYPKTSDRQTLRLVFQLTRMKELELIEFFDIYQSTDVRIELHDNTIWQAKLVGGPLTRTPTGRHSDDATTGYEVVSVPLTFSAIKLQ